MGTCQVVWSIGWSSLVASLMTYRWVRQLCYVTTKRCRLINIKLRNHSIYFRQMHWNEIGNAFGNIPVSVLFIWVVTNYYYRVSWDAFQFLRHLKNIRRWKRCFTYKCSVFIQWLFSTWQAFEISSFFQSVFIKIFSIFFPWKLACINISFQRGVIFLCPF